MREALVRSLDADELTRALGVATRCLLRELREAAPEVAERLETPLLELASAP